MGCETVCGGGGDRLPQPPFSMCRTMNQNHTFCGGLAGAITYQWLPASSLPAEALLHARLSRQWPIQAFCGRFDSLS
jgi:hypothetical protein